MAGTDARDLPTGLRGVARKHYAPGRIGFAAPKFGIDEIGKAPQQQPRRRGNRDHIRTC